MVTIGNVGLLQAGKRALFSCMQVVYQELCKSGLLTQPATGGCLGGGLELTQLDTVHAYKVVSEDDS